MATNIARHRSFIDSDSRTLTFDSIGGEKKQKNYQFRCNTHSPTQHFPFHTLKSKKRKTYKAVKMNTPHEAPASYKQPTKHAARKAAISHAVNILTKRREDCTIAPADYISQVLRKFKSPKSHPDYHLAASQCKPEDIESWKDFRSSAIGKKEPKELTVAYLAGPEPTNDIEILLELGVRAENIWAFELNPGVFESALLDLKKANLRGIKLINIGIEDYFISSPRRFDIIYFDACAPLPSHKQKTTKTLTNIFKHSALSPLGVLITNFSEPDTSNEIANNNYSSLISNYLFPKCFLDNPKTSSNSITDGAEAEGYWLPCMFTSDEQQDADELEIEKNFLEKVKANFEHYYSSFITRHISDIASIIAPSVRAFNSILSKEIVNNIESAKVRGLSLATPQQECYDENEERQAELHKILDKLPKFGEVDKDCSTSDQDQVQAELASFLQQNYPSTEGGEALEASNLYSILYTLALCGLVSKNSKDKQLPERIFFENWAKQLTGSQEKTSGIDSLAVFYALRHDTSFWANSMIKLAQYDYHKKMPFLCDIPNEDVSFYPPFAQISYPAHNKVSETKRFRYTAEGKSTPMYLDVLPFDECRYIYDWLSTAPLIEGDWDDLSRQLIFRMALDAIVKNKKCYQEDYLYGCHAVATDSDYFDPPKYKKREEIVQKNQ